MKTYSCVPFSVLIISNSCCVIEITQGKVRVESVRNTKENSPTGSLYVTLAEGEQ
jgi:hypothetical protein